jgi:hypothetical protein
MRSSHLLAKICPALLFALTLSAAADPAPFDLTGPTVAVEVTRGSITLPAEAVPNLAPGDRLSIKAELGPDHSAHYLLVPVFLRGSVDPPPTSWFTPCETWTGKCAQKGLNITVPKDAQQLLVFMAPETGGDFKTLMHTVRASPGVFVRASQDLKQSELDRARLNSYLAAIRSLGASDPAQLKEAAPLLSRSLGIKVDEKCLEKDPQMQVTCLSQGRESLILSDGHSASITQELTSGAASDLAMNASNTPQMRSGLYGPYIGSLLDIARLFDSFHTAQYQYIPALATPHGKELALALNAPPSFQDPKSVLVLALPAVAHAQFPPLRPVAPKETYCANKEPLVLPAEGAPLAFATGYAHDLTLRVPASDGSNLELPAKADPARGGFVVDTTALHGVALGPSIVTTLHGRWGFDAYDGPSFQLVSSRTQNWSLRAGEEGSLIVGRDDTVHLHAASVACIADITLQDAEGHKLKSEWKAVQPDEAEVKLAMHEALPGALTLLIRQYGSTQPQQLALRAYAEAGRLETFAVHAGDKQGILRGNRLDEVQELVVSGMQFLPGTLTNSSGHDELSMQAADAPPVAGLKPGAVISARVTLKDGRLLDVPTSIEPPRPSAVLIGKSAHGLPSAADSGNIRLASQDELPQDARLTFALRAQSPASFSRDDKIEVATSDGSSAMLEVGNGSMTFQNSKVAVATLEPARVLGSSAFGPLRYRMVSSGIAGDWRPLVTLVRLPALKRIECSAGGACTLFGANLFLLQSVAADAKFTQPTAVPDGYTEQSLAVPRPPEGQLYVKLRDDPSVINLATVNVEAPPQPAAPAATDTASGGTTSEASALATAPAATSASTASNAPAGAQPAATPTSGAGPGPAAAPATVPATAAAPATAPSAAPPPAPSAHSL